jgi:ribosomal protein S18 acetylase RimI-like enzyme
MSYLRQSMGAKKAEPELNIRWLIRRDMPAINEINIESSYQLLEEDIVKMLRTRNFVGMVIERGDQVQGYMIYALEKNAIDLHHLVIDPMFQFQGLGRALLDALRSKMEFQKRSRIFTTVSEYNVQAQVFFRACGFECVETIDDWDENGDGYLFEYQQ